MAEQSDIEKFQRWLQSQLDDVKSIEDAEERERRQIQLESAIQEAINFLTKGKTTIVIAHRLSTILNSNKIYVIDSGEVIASGNHEDLLVLGFMIRV